MHIAHKMESTINIVSSNLISWLYATYLLAHLETKVYQVHAMNSVEEELITGFDFCFGEAKSLKDIQSFVYFVYQVPGSR